MHKDIKYTILTDIDFLQKNNDVHQKIMCTKRSDNYNIWNFFRLSKFFVKVTKDKSYLYEFEKKKNWNFDYVGRINYNK